MYQKTGSDKRNCLKMKELLIKYDDNLRNAAVSFPRHTSVMGIILGSQTDAGGEINKLGKIARRYLAK